ncbi:MAG: hypothetical protein C0467_26605 [Planctomycetaceae bacterium]|nr:hypothetical protein [Planctomycetaceae bacterium]
MNNIPWWGYVILAGLAWGTYVPIIFYGGTELTTKPGTIGGRLASILCVGGAYFFMGVVIPLVLMSLREDARPEWKTNGLVFSGLAGVAGAVGAICVIFASKAAVDQAKLDGVNPATYRMYIAPLIFSLAPAINTLLSLLWHPKPGEPWHFDFEMPGWKLPLGILFVALGTFLVLMSKEEVEAAKGGPKPPPPPVNPAPSES